MSPHFLNLLRRSWDALISASSTSTFGLVQWTVGITVVTSWAATVAVKWREYRRGKYGQPLRKALVGSFVQSMYLLGGITLYLFLTYVYFVGRTVYDDHQHLVAQNAQLAEMNKSLSAEVQWRKHNISTTDPVFPNLIYLLQAFSIYRHAVNGQRCVVMITAPRESAPLASVVAQLSNAVSNCSTFGPMDQSVNPDVETETITGMVADMVVFHAAKDDKAANQLFNYLGNQIRLKRSYQLPQKDDYSLPPGVGPVHVVWLQFGTNSKWNSELYGPNR